MKLLNEIVLAKDTVFNRYHGIVAEYNFMITEDTLKKAYIALGYKNDYESLDNFLDLYDIKEEGKAIYDYCKNNNLEILYEDWNSIDATILDMYMQMEHEKQEG